LFIFGGVQSQELLTLDFQHAVQLRQWLKRRIGAGVASDCRLAADLEKIQIDPNDVTSQTSLVGIWRRLLLILQRYITACLCSALLPPCAPCDDTAVLLACLTVQECEVVDVCNLERTFVLSWPAMRYWLPWFGQVGEFFEKLCCEPQKPWWDPIDRKPDAITQSVASRIHLEREPRLMTDSAAIAAATSKLSPLESAFRLTTPAGNPALERIARVIGRSVLPGPGELPAIVETAVVPQGEPLAEALRSPEPRRLLTEMIEARVAELRPASDLTVIVDDVDERLKTVKSSMTELQRELKRRPTTAELKTATTPIKKLVTSTAENTRRIEKVSADVLAQIDALKKRIAELEER
jgi:hypothetical protein